MKVVNILPLKKGFSAENLTYFSTKDVGVGDIVKIPIRKKEVSGLVIETNEATNLKADIKDSDFELRKISEVYGPSFLTPEFVSSAQKCSQYFACGMGEILRTMIPNILTENYEKLESGFEKKDNEYTFQKKELKPEKVIFQSPSLDRIGFYKTFIRENFAKGKSVFFILPTINEIENFYENLSSGVEKYCMILHSGLSAKKIINNWNQALVEDHPIVIFATTPFLCLPKKNIGVIVLEHENSNAYKNLSRPKIDFRIFTEILAFNSGIKLILADSMLSVETIERHKKGILGEVAPPSFRLDSSVEKHILDMRTQLKEDGSKTKFKVLSEEMIKEIKRVTDSGGKIFLFTLRKGFAPQTVCRDCGSIVFCENCHAPLVLFGGEKKNERVFKCPKCNLKKDAGLLCSVCNSWNLFALGIGVEKVIEELEGLLKNIKIFQLDKENAKNKKESLEIVDLFEKETGSILVGTEYALQYLSKPVETVAIISFDSLFSIPDFRMNEKIIKLLSSLESFANKKIIIQTRNPEEKVLQCFLSGVMQNFYREEIESRKKWNYPPFSTFIKVTFRGSEKETEQARLFLAENFSIWEPTIMPRMRSKIDRKIVTNMIIRLSSPKWSILELDGLNNIDMNLRTRLLSLPPSFNTEINPENLL